MFEIVLVAKCTLGCNLTKINASYNSIQIEKKQSWFKPSIFPVWLIMEELDGDYEDELFDVEEISNIVKYAVDTSLSTCDYQNNKEGVCS